MVNEQEQDSGRKPANQGVRDVVSEPNKINASTPYDCSGKNLTPYGGLLPVITMLEKLGFQSLVEQTVTSKRIPRAMDLYRFVLGIVLGLYIGFPRLNQLRFIARDPILTGILRVAKLPVQSSFWRFVNALHRHVARQILTIMRTMRERVWEAANVKLEVVTIDTDTTVHTLYGQQMGGRKGYNPKNKGKKSYQPMLTFIAETREYVWGELRNGDRPSGKQIGDHLRNVHAALPPGVKRIYGRADSGFYCREAVDMRDPIYFVVWFYSQRGGAENLIKEANNDAGLAAHPSGRFDVNGNHFQLAMLAYNLNCWLMLFNREPQADATALRHTTLATSRLRFLFVAAKIWRHAGRTGVSYSDHYEEKGLFTRRMDRLRRIAPRAQGYAPVMLPALR
jgi:hypothetical protein